MAFRIAHTQTVEQREPRKRDKDYLSYIASLSCVICGNPNVECAHIRMASFEYGKTETGAGRKPDDYWVVPLCANHHRLTNEAQHSGGERDWWEEQCINPFDLCRDLNRVYPDIEVGELLIGATRALAKLRRGS